MGAADSPVRTASETFPRKAVRLCLAWSAVTSSRPANARNSPSARPSEKGPSYSKVGYSAAGRVSGYKLSSPAAEEPSSTVSPLSTRSNSRDMPTENWAAISDRVEIVS